MSKEQKVKSTKRVKFWRFVRWFIGIFIVLLLVGYLVVTSEAFVKSVIVPKIGKALNSEFTVTEAQVRPFTSVMFRNVKLKPNGAETLIVVNAVEAHYSLWSIMRGNINVDSVLVDSPTITVVEQADGSMNLPHPTSTSKPGASKPSAPEKTSSAPNVDIKKVTLKNATVRYTKMGPKGIESVKELSNVAVTLSDLHNGGTAKLDLSAWVSMKQTGDQPGNFNATMTGNLSLGLTPGLKPSTLGGKTVFTVTKVDGVFSEFASLAATLDCDATPTQVKQVAVHFTQSGQPIGDISISGPFDSAKQEGKLKLLVNSIDRRVLNLATAGKGLDFTTTTIASSNDLDLSKGGKQVALVGSVDVANFQVKEQGKATPKMGTVLKYDVSVDLTGKAAVVKAFNLLTTQDSRSIIEGKLTNPMTVTFGEGGAGGSDGELSLTLNNLNFADWQVLAGDPTLAGTLNGRVNVQSKEGGKALALDLDARLTGVSAKAGSNAISGLGAQLKGVVNVKQSEVFTGQFALNDLDGRFGAYQFAKYGVTTDFDVTKKGAQIDIRKFGGELRESGNSGGKFDITGTLNTTNSVGKFQVNLVDFNQNGLRPFLESMLSDKKLVSVAVNSSTTATLGEGGDIAVKSDSKVTNLVVQDPKGSLPATPLEARLQVDAGVAKKIAQIRQGELTLTPTERAKNSLTLSGTMDMSKQEAISGNLKLAAESLDLTRYYDIFESKPKPAATTEKGKPAPAPAPTTPVPAPKEQEPGAVKLPLKNFVADASIGKLYLREIEASDFKATANVDGGHVVVKPLQLSLNGAPVKTDLDLDLSVPGYRYDVAFSAQSVPLAPFVNTFQPERKGQVQGVLIANAQIKGAGTTGENLQKNLAGQFSFLTTNINLSVDHIRNPVITSILNVIIDIPQLLKNPTGVVGNWVGKLTGLGKKDGWMDEISGAPIQVIQVNGTAGNGVVKLHDTEINSSKFRAQANGDVAIAKVLNDSKVNLPVTVSLSRGLAQALALSEAGLPTNAVYVPMDNFLTVEGTAGNPKTKIDYAKLTVMAGKGIGKNLVGGTGNIIGGAAKTAENILGFGKKDSSTNGPASTTNQPSSNPLGNVIKGVGGLLGGKKDKETNQPAPPK